jgi:hypothetical protein
MCSRLLLALSWIVVAGAHTPASAINRCVLKDGKVVFQDRACEGAGEAIQVRPASGPAPTVAKPASSPAAPASAMTPAQRMEEDIAQSQRERRRTELEVRTVPSLLAQLAQLRSQCDSELRSLQIKKQSANNNLAGAQWETSISQEMSAISARCDTRNRELREDLDIQRRACQALGGCK